MTRSDDTRVAVSALGAAILDLVSRVVPGAEDPVLGHLLGPDLSALVRRMRWSTLVCNCGSTSTKVAVYGGLVLLAAQEVHVEPGGRGDVAERVEGVLSWLSAQGMHIGDVTGIATRGGLLAPVPGGTYAVVDAMRADLERAPYRHASNLSVPMALELARRAGEGTLVTTTDPGTTDDSDIAHRLTGSPRMRADASMAHHLSIRAAADVVAGLLGRRREDLHLVVCHMGGGMSAGRLKGGRVEQVCRAFGDLPSANRAGRLPLDRVIRLLADREWTLADLESEVVGGHGGLMGLAGTDDFRALFAFREAGATPTQAEKIDLITRFFADRVAAAVLELSADERPLDVVVLTGGLARDARFCEMVARRIHLPLPVVRLPGSVEGQALAAGLLRASANPSTLMDYVAARDALEARRAEEEAILATPIFERPLRRRRPGSPPRHMDDILALAHSGSEPPYIAIAGADNEEALLAARGANHEGAFRLARFLLVGPYARVSELAWELDVPIDDENYVLVDAQDPSARAVDLLEAGAAEILMKGSVTTAGLLKSYLASLKRRGGGSRGPRLSHLSLFDVPGRSKLIAVTDAAMNTNPDVEARVEILENALRALRRLNIGCPKVAVISATEKPSEAVSSSVEARAIVERFSGRDDLVIEGPLSVDLALSPESAREKGWKGQIRGDADLLLVPTIDVGNAIYKTFTVAGSAVTAGAIVGGDRPLVLTSRGDSARSKLSSIALALLLARRGGVA